MEPILFPDVEGLLVGHLNAVLDVPVSTRVPNPRPPAFVRIVRTGGPAVQLVVDQAQLTIEAWASSSVTAFDLARTVRAHINALTGQRIGGIQVLRVVEFSGPANLPDPDSNQARYSWTVQLPVRGVPVDA